MDEPDKLSQITVSYTNFQNSCDTGHSQTRQIQSEVSNILVYKSYTLVSKSRLYRAPINGTFASNCFAKNLHSWHKNCNCDTEISESLSTIGQMLKSIRQVLITALLATAVSGTAVAADNGYVDTVYGWGSWELGIEPAAGGPIAQTRRPANVGNVNPQFRPNSNGAFTSRSNEVVLNTSGNGPSPVPMPAAPTVPAGPAQPLGPNNPPLGGNPVNF